MMSSDADPVHLLRGKIQPATPGRLTLADYGHIQPTLDIVRPWLRHAQGTQRRGVNLYVHGAPGTGKTELARALAQDMGCELFEVASEDEDGDPISGQKRLRAFRAAQSFLAQRKALLLFDEVEDVFHDSPLERGTAQSHKAWLNRMLEDNPRAHAVAVQRRAWDGRGLPTPLRHGVRAARAAAQPAHAHRAGALRRSAGRAAPGPRGRRRAPGPSP